MNQPILIVPDTHIPYQNEIAWKLMIAAATDLKPYHIVTIGDLADFYSVSSHSKSPARSNQLFEEVEAVKIAIDELDALGAKNKIFIAGNHCDRLERYLNDKAPELFGLVDVPGLFELKKRKWAYVPYKHDCKIGKINFTHDVGAAGRNATFKALDIYQHSIVTGHAHRLQMIVEGNACGEYKLSAQFGWLGDASKVDYMHRVNVLKNWALGFGVGVIDSVTGIGYLQPVPIIKRRNSYSCCVNGKIYKA